MPVSGQNFCQNMVPEVIENGVNSPRQGFVLMLHASFKTYEILKLKYPQDIWYILPTSNVFHSPHAVHNVEINKMLD